MSRPTFNYTRSQQHDTLYSHSVLHIVLTQCSSHCTHTVFFTLYSLCVHHIVLTQCPSHCTHSGFLKLNSMYVPLNVLIQFLYIELTQCSTHCTNPVFYKLYSLIVLHTELTQRVFQNCLSQFPKCLHIELTHFNTKLQ